MSELQEHLAELPVDFDHETWKIDGFETANWAMRKLARAEARLADIQRQALDEASKISDWANVVSKNPQRDKVFFENQLKHYLMELRNNPDDGRKSLVLPDGVIESRTINAKAQVTDKELFLKWCLANHREGWIRTKEEPNLEALKEGVEFDGDSVIDSQTGEIVEGLVVLEADIAVKVTVSQV